MTTEAVETVETTPPWRRLGRGTVVPILLLLGLLFVLGQLHVDLAQGYTAPRLIADGRGAYAFWDEGGREPFFCLREAKDGEGFGRKARIPGVLGGAALAGEHLVALFAGTSDERWFYSVYERKHLDRLWSGDFADPELGLPNPRHLATVGSEVYALGTDRRGALKAARLGSELRLVPCDPTLPGAGVPPRAAEAAPGTPAEPDQVPPPASWASGADGEGVVVAWRVLRDPAAGRQGAGEVRWTRFDGKSFAPLRAAPEDLSAFTLVRTTGFGSAESRLLLLGVAQSDKEPRLRAWALSTAAGGEPAFQALAETVDYPREGFTGSAGLASLAAGELPAGAGAAPPRLVLLAQIGGAIRWRVREGERWGAWEDFARLPAEQRAVVYGWFGAVLALCAALIVQGLRGLQRRGRPPREATGAARPARADAATLLERGLAFTTDGLLVLGLASLLPPFQALAQGDRGLADPRLQLSLLVLFLVGMLGWLAIWEGVLCRTPGKWLLGLEVQDQDGGRPSAASLLVRNLFRIELLLPPVWLAGLVTLTVMLLTPRHQRPGDILARTVVVRRAQAPRPALQGPTA